MNGINAWCKLVACVSVLSAVIMLVIPESGTKKAFRTLMTVIMIFTFLHPLSNKDEFSFEANNYNLFDDNTAFNSELYDYNNMPMLYSAQTEAEKYLDKKMKAADIDAVCTVVCAIKDNSLYIEKVTVEAPSANEENILTLVKEACTEESVIIINGDMYE